MKRFDRKFGADRIAQLPVAPGVYLFKDDTGRVLYVGKAKNLRRRLSSYRNASRRKAHRKMHMLVREASELEIRVQPTERDARVAENELIRSLEPPHNVEGAFSFLYPAIGLRRDERRTLLCFTTSTDAWSEFEFTWYGHFRSRWRAKEAFNSLIDLLGMVGHLERRSTLEPAPSLRGSRLAGIRQLKPELVTSIAGYLAGESLDGLKEGFVVAIFVMFVLMAIPLKSYIQPLIVLSAVPFGIVGAILGHLIMGMPMSMLSLCGVIALAGIVVNDSLVLVSYVNSHRQAGMPLHRAVREAGMVRFRPILLTSLTTAAGITPLMLEKSVQAQFLIPMAVALAYGVLFSTVITLLLVPASYLMIEDLQDIFRWLYGRGPALAGAAGGQSLDTMSQGLASQRLASQALIDADEVARADATARGVREAEPKGGESVPASSGGVARGSE